VNFGSSEINQTGRHSRLLGLGVLLMIFSLMFSVLSSPADNLPSKQTILQEARCRLDQEPVNPKKLQEAISLLEGYAPKFPDELRFPLYLSEAYYRLADPEADVAREFPYYEKTATYAQKVLEMDPNRTEGHYWYGLALLKRAQKKGGISAYFDAKKGIKELETVRQALPSYDHAGASRVLGLLYCLAPQWTPFGDLDKSIRLAQEATHLAPDYPLNRLYLADAYKKRGDKAAAAREYQKILANATKLPHPQAEGFSQQARASLRSLGYPI
jgi:predicted Zn-dependent protease